LQATRVACPRAAGSTSAGGASRRPPRPAQARSIQPRSALAQEPAPLASVRDGGAASDSARSMRGARIRAAGQRRAEPVPGLSANRGRPDPRSDGATAWSGSLATRMPWIGRVHRRGARFPLAGCTACRASHRREGSLRLNRRVPDASATDRARVRRRAEGAA